MTSTRVTWVDGLMFVSTAEGSHGSFVLDAKSEAGGRDSGTLPMEALLSALGSCTGMDVISILM
ncbi:MAG TPA: peroxiredoxin, partial [Armatimonadota bacterium]|nr:peroxiredoxin [Armatimonadota bacterium]